MTDLEIYRTALEQIADDTVGHPPISLGNSIHTVARAALERVAAKSEAIIRACQKKRRYLTPEAALQAGADRFDDGAGPLRVYDCTICRGFHLTKETLEEFAKAAL